MQTHQNIKDLNIYSDFLRYDFKYLIKILINNKFLFFYTSLISILSSIIYIIYQPKLFEGNASFALERYVEKFTIIEEEDFKDRENISKDYLGLYSIKKRRGYSYNTIAEILKYKLNKDIIKIGETKRNLIFPDLPNKVFVNYDYQTNILGLAFKNNSKKVTEKNINNIFSASKIFFDKKDIGYEIIGEPFVIKKDISKIERPLIILILTFLFTLFYAFIKDYIKGRIYDKEDLKRYLKTPIFQINYLKSNEISENIKLFITSLNLSNVDDEIRKIPIIARGNYPEEQINYLISQLNKFDQKLNFFFTKDLTEAKNSKIKILACFLGELTLIDLKENMEIFNLLSIDINNILLFKKERNNLSK